MSISVAETAAPLQRRRGLAVAGLFRSPLAEGAIVAVLAATVAGVLFRSTLLGSHVYASNDLVMIVWPFRAFVDRALAAHQLPLWVPGVWMGVPFLADNDAGLLYPFQLPFLLRPAQLAVGWVLWLHAVLSVGTMYAYCRLALRLHPIASFGAGLVFALNGYALAHTGLAWSAYEAPWPPLLFLALHRAVEGRIAWAWLGPVAVALALLGGQSQNMFWTGYWLAPYAAALVISAGPRWRPALVAAGSLGFFVLGGVLLAAVQFLPETELLANGVRLDSGLSFSDATIAPLPAMPPWRLLLPDSTYLGEGAGWIGLVATALALFGTGMSFVRRRRRGVVLVFLVTATTSYVLTMGAQTPLYHVAYDLLPGMQQLRLPVRWLYPATLALCVLVGIGLEELRLSLRPLSTRPTWPILPVAAVLCLGLTAGVFLPLSHGQAVRTLWEQGRWLHLASLIATAVGASALLANLTRRLGALATTAIVVAAIALELVAASQFMEFNHPGSTDYVIPRPIPTYVAAHGPGRFLDLTAIPWQDAPTTGANDTGLLTGADSLTGYSSSWPTTRMGQLDRDLLTPLHANPAQVISHLELLRSLGVRYIVTTTDQAPLAHSPELVQRVTDGPYVLYELVQPGARAWTTCGAAFVGSSREALAAIMDPEFRGSDLYLEGTGVTSGGGRCGQAAITADGIDSVTLRAELPADGWLVLADTWYPGWSATVDGRPIQIEHADYLLRAVRVPAGQHMVLFEYHPGSFTAGLTLSVVAAAGWLVSLGLVVWARRRRSRPRSTQTSSG